MLQQWNDKDDTAGLRGYVQCNLILLRIKATNTAQRMKPQKSCRRHVGKGGDLDGKREKCRNERVGPVAANADNLERNKEQGTQGSSKNCTSRESVSPLSCLIRGFRNKYH